MDASVDFLLQNLKELVLYHVNLISNAKHDLEELNKELDRLKAVLKDASKKVKKDETFKVWEKQIREVVYDVEDTIDTCITQIAAEKAKKGGHFRKLFPKKSRVGLAEEVRSLRVEKVQPLFKMVNFASITIADEPDLVVAETRALKPKKKQNIVGFDDEADTIIGFLNKESNKLESITIVGMPGLGKTTLAWKIHEDQRIKFEFPVVIWVNISDDFNIKNVLLNILRKFTGNNMPNLSTEELTEKVRGHLKEGKFLIVMDDVWTPKAWEDLKTFLPMKNKEGRVLITSRSKDVAIHANPTQPEAAAHMLRFLTEEESWELLQYEVYDSLGTVPQKLVKVGKTIAKNCDGLPLSLVVIGGILKDKISATGGSISSINKAWGEISESVKTYLVLQDKDQLLQKIISLSYTKLPYELRNCFLYLGMFPEDADVPVKKVIRLWIAEGFIQEVQGQSLEQTAHDILSDFVNRNLLIVKETKPSGEPKVCQVHDTIREFCKTEADVKNLNLFQEITKSKHGIFEPTSAETLEKCRRLCIHSHVHEFFMAKQSLPKARSFLCFHKYPINLAATQIATVTDGFGLLRVYDAATIRFPKIPQKLLNLLHLRYLTLALDGECKTLPDVICDLWNLQTFIVDISSGVLDIQADIWKLRNLRHLKTKASIVLKNMDGFGGGGKNLQTLSRLSPQSCTERVFAKAKNLVTLAVQGELSREFLESGSLDKLPLLNKLKLIHQVTTGDVSEKPMTYLPEHNKFPPNLRILVLTGTYLEWDRLSVLERFIHLEELKLRENACHGDTWEVSGGFKRLELLLIERSSHLVYLSVKDGAFPELRYLLIKNCEKLEEIPKEISNNLELLRIEHVTAKAVSCAKEIGSGKNVAKGFKLDIAPADLLKK